MLNYILKNNKISLLGIVFLFCSIFLVNVSLVSANTGYDVQSGSANNTVWGGGDNANIIKNQTGLGNQDPRTTVANIINIALGFLGIIAILIIMYAGFFVDDV
jgi:hypothetical protein